MSSASLLCLCPARRLFTAVEQRLPQLSGPALALLTASLPQLLPAGGNLRLWRQLGGVVQSQGSRLTAEQLCEVLPLVQVGRGGVTRQAAQVPLKAVMRTQQPWLLYTCGSEPQTESYLTVSPWCMCAVNVCSTRLLTCPCLWSG